MTFSQGQTGWKMLVCKAAQLHTGFRSCLHFKDRHRRHDIQWLCPQLNKGPEWLCQHWHARKTVAWQQRLSAYLCSHAKCAITCVCVRACMCLCVCRARGREKERAIKHALTLDWAVYFLAYLEFSFELSCEHIKLQILLEMFQHPNNCLSPSSVRVCLNLPVHFELSLHGIKRWIGEGCKTTFSSACCKHSSSLVIIMDTSLDYPEKD
jgi:hypothetical protein